MYTNVDGIPVWGQHDESTLGQIQRCATDPRVAAAALMADGHVGYSIPIGGVIAYRNAISPNGVGFDISCLVAGTPVTTGDGYHLPIEQVTGSAPITCWDGEDVRPVASHIGVVERGMKPVLRIVLTNGRTITATSDHRVLTADGWKEAAVLAATDVVACSPFIGMPYVAQTGELTLDIASERIKRELHKHGLWPLSLSSPLFPVVVRLAGYISGDGHLAQDGMRISLYTTYETDAAHVVEDFARLGYHARIHRRKRYPNRRAEIHVYVNSVALHALFAALGSPVGKKCWPEEPMPWLFACAPWVRAHFLSAFCSAEMQTPKASRTAHGNLCLKQTGEDRQAIDFIARLFRSLDFEVSISTSGPARGTRQDYILQLIGGDADKTRFIETVGFCYAHEKRLRAAQNASLCWERAALVRQRTAAREEARRLYTAGTTRRDVIAAVAQRFAVSPAFVHHSLYTTRGTPRRPGDVTVTPRTSGEICWIAIDRIEPSGVLPVYDIVTADPAEAFFASGIVVHNCGLKAAKTNLREEEVRPEIGRIMDEVARTVVFGLGRSSGLAADHPLFADPTWKEIRPLFKLQQTARQQLGTVGSGNHFVDVFADEAGWIWVGVHFGSRGFGHRTCTGFLNLAAGRAFDDKAPGEHMDQPATVLSLDTPLGQDYFQAMTLAGRYAYAGRDFVVNQVLDILGAQAVDEVHNHHNFAWIEEHNGEKVVVVRKGATPAWPGQRGFVGGSMGDVSVVVEGVDGEESAAALYSTVHGAGRVMSRTQAAGKRRKGQVVKPGAVSREMMLDWLRREGVELRGAGTDESPHVYRRLPEVLAHHAGTIRILHTLRPLGVAMAGEDIFDPYKD